MTRDLTRTRKKLVREVTQHTQRIHKVLEDANIKLSGDRRLRHLGCDVAITPQAA